MKEKSDALLLAQRIYTDMCTSCLDMHSHSNGLVEFNRLIKHHANEEGIKLDNTIREQTRRIVYDKILNHGEYYMRKIIKLAMLVNEGKYMNRNEGDVNGNKGN